MTRLTRSKARLRILEALERHGPTCINVLRDTHVRIVPTNAELEEILGELIACKLIRCRVAPGYRGKATVVYELVAEEKALEVAS